MVERVNEGMQEGSEGLPGAQGLWTETEAGTHWTRYLLVLAAVLGLLGVSFYGTAESIVSIWIRSETFAHGFLIVPISLWLVWEKRQGLRRLSPQPTYLPIPLMIPAGLAWLLGHLVDVLVIQQFAFVALIVLAIWSILGHRVTRYLAFPILFLFFGVPVGEGLIYPMMNFTADFTVGMLRLTGIPVYRDGTFFSIPSGNWSVVEGCSGVRYIIASVTLGVLYAYLTYSRWWKRVLFVAFSILVPIIANGLRAYMIVMIGHLSDMKLATGVDHLIYGWVFFGIIIAIMFFIGAFFRDPPQAIPAGEAPAGDRRSGPAVKVGVTALAAAVLWPGLAWALQPDTSGDQSVALKLPAPAGAWKSADREYWSWRPRIVAADGERYDFYVSEDGERVGLYVGVYRTQRQDAELLSSQNQMVVQKHPEWSDKEQTRRSIELAGSEMLVNQSRLDSRSGARLLVWSWYRIGEYQTANPYVGKLMEAWSLLSSGRRDGSLIAVAAPYTDRLGEAESTLKSFIGSMLPAIEAAVEQALAPAS